MEKLDDKDYLLLAALKKNARASLVSLARDIGLSRSATHDRITRLEEKGAISGYTIIQNPATSPKVRAYMTVKLNPDVQDGKITDMIALKDGVMEAFCLTGDIDILVHCACHTAEDLSELREDIAAIAGIQSVYTRIILSASLG